MEFEVQDMTCGHCASRITQAVKEIDASATVDVSLDQKRVKIASAATADALLHAITEAGYSPALKG
jgi:copper chaperone